MWWIGFDCGHAWDVMPGLEAQMAAITGRGPFRMPGAEYRTLEYVQAECADLARQLARLTAEASAHGEPT